MFQKAFTCSISLINNGASKSLDVAWHSLQTFLPLSLATRTLHPLTFQFQPLVLHSLALPPHHPLSIPKVVLSVLPSDVPLPGAFFSSHHFLVLELLASLACGTCTWGASEVACA
eukprot:Gb_08077 [translate_table: standard]